MKWNEIKISPLVTDDVKGIKEASPLIAVEMDGGCRGIQNLYCY